MSLRGGAGWILPLGVIGCVLLPAGAEQSTTAASELSRCASIAEAIERQLRRVPQGPGVYLFRNANVGESGE